MKGDIFLVSLLLGLVWAFLALSSSIIPFLTWKDVTNPNSLVSVNTFSIASLANQHKQQEDITKKDPSNHSGRAVDRTRSTRGCDILNKRLWNTCPAQHQTWSNSLASVHVADMKRHLVVVVDPYTLLINQKA